PETSAFGIWLNKVRAQKGLTVVELANKAGVSIPTIYNLESGRIDNPQEKTRKRLVEALGETLPTETVKATEDAANIEGIGNLVDFDPHDEDGLPTGPGVYVFYDISQRPIYVGESSNLTTRLRTYNDKFWFKRPIVEYGSYIKISDTSLRKQIEKILIKFLKANAVLNKQHVERAAD